MHVGIILDGNRRYARRLGKVPWQGHTYGADKLVQIMDWCKEFSIDELTLYAFSMENFSRPALEKKKIFSLFSQKLDEIERDDLCEKNEICIRFIGRLSLFPHDLVSQMNHIMDISEQYRKHRLNLCVAYGGRQEILDAVKGIIEDVENKVITSGEISEDTLQSHLYLTSEPDLIIRPGGEIRVSNFLLWQSSYAEWYFTNRLWPEFRKEDLKAALTEYKKRKRRFGR